MPITALPTPPTRADAANFAVRADAFLGALPTFTSEANALQSDVNSKQTSAATSATNAATSATNAANSATAAAASASSAAATAGVTAWNPATAYTVGQNVYDTTDFLTYRRKVAGTTATRPGLDTTNWELISGNVTLSTDQSITGIKTFTQTINGNITNANVAATLSDTTRLVPAGSVIYFAGNTAPSGWLKANGAAVSRTVYSALFSVFGTTFGAGDGSTTFNLPDLRGEFIRSWDDGRGVDVGRAFGSAQAGDIQSHTHNATANNVGGRYTATGDNGPYIGAASTPTSATGGTETRPRNIALLACIKF